MKNPHGIDVEALAMQRREELMPRHPLDLPPEGCETRGMSPEEREAHTGSTTAKSSGPPGAGACTRSQGIAS